MRILEKVSIPGKDFKNWKYLTIFHKNWNNRKNVNASTGVFLEILHFPRALLNAQKDFLNSYLDCIRMF